MRLRPVFIAIGILFFSIPDVTAQLATDSSVVLFPHWKKGEVHTLVIKTATEETTEGKTKSSMTRFNAKFTILTRDTSGYIMEWVYTAADLPSNELSVENVLLSSLLNQKFLYKLSLTGKFIEMLNYDSMKIVFDLAIEALLKKNGDNQARQISLTAVKQMMTSRKNMEIVLFKQIKFYNLSFGYKYKTHFVQTNQLVMPNALGGKPFNATEKIQLTSLDTVSKICIIERKTEIDDSIALKNQIFEYVQRIDKEDSAMIARKLGSFSSEFTQKSSQTIQYAKGILLHSKFQMIMNFGFENRSSVLEIETVD
jgi:hypothetical protein